ncbi:MAG: response regulator [bacterium]
MNKNLNGLSGPASPKSLRILVAEDDEINRMVIAAFLDDLPFLDVTTVEDGRAALEAATTTAFDLMIFDQNMPFITGDRVIRHLRASGTVNGNTPVIRLSADTSVASTDALHRTSSLPKPLHKDDFVRAIKRALKID